MNRRLFLHLLRIYADMARRTGHSFAEPVRHIQQAYIQALEDGGMEGEQLDRQAAWSADTVLREYAVFDRRWDEPPF